MDADSINKIISYFNQSTERLEFLRKFNEGELYYRNKNNIKRKPIKVREDNPLKTADNRISHNWHGLLVNQKASYVFGREPTIDVKDKDLNKKIIRLLGDEWGKTLKDLTIKASNAGIAWLHYWIEEPDKFQYGIVSSDRIIPIYSNDLKQRLIAVIHLNEETDSIGNSYIKYEYWNDKECSLFKKSAKGIECLNILDNETNTFNHNLGSVPFIYFNNNSIKEYDLYMYRDLIDQFDIVTSGFANDIEDIQEIIFILKGYGGEELEEFMKDLKDFKAVKTDNDGDVKTIKAEIPVEARAKFLDDLKKSIFLFGMGVNPDKNSLGDSSGVALKFLYSLLELKASMTRTEFDCSIKVLVRAILNYLGKNTGQDISITYYKNMVTNDSEVVDIISKSDGIISDKSKTKNHPYTENLDEELEQIKKEYMLDPDYDKNFGKRPLLEAGSGE